MSDDVVLRAFTFISLFFLGGLFALWLDAEFWVITMICIFVVLGVGIVADVFVKLFDTPVMGLFNVSEDDDCHHHNNEIVKADGFVIGVVKKLFCVIVAWMVVREMAGVLSDKEFERARWENKKKKKKGVRRERV